MDLGKKCMMEKRGDPGIARRTKNVQVTRAGATAEDHRLTPGEHLGVTAMTRKEIWRCSWLM
jgi:hypothetical protein